MRIADYMGPDGLLSVALEDFQYRESQCQLANRVLETLETGSVLLAEAGPGVGKTYAYLVPLLIRGIRTVISTGTIALQDQLSERDIPRISRITGHPVRIAVLKGRNNYLCLKRYEEMRWSTGELDVCEQLRMDEIRRWAETTATGDLSECASVVDNTRERTRLTSTVDSCEGRNCAFYERCFLVEARHRVNEADLVITNHHLLFSDWLLKQDGFSSLLPEVDAFILDEAHLIPDLAIQMFSESVSQSELETILKNPVLTALQDTLRLDGRTLGDRIGQAWSCLLQFGCREGVSNHGDWPLDLRESLSEIADTLHALIAFLDTDLPEGMKTEERRVLARIENVMTRIARRESVEDTGESMWLEGAPKGFSLLIEPRNPGVRLKQVFGQMNAAWILMSASLTVAGDFSYFRSRLGLENVSEIRVPSPYDHLRQAMLFLPEGLPPVDAPDYLQAFFDLALSLIEINPGGTFLLFTSHRALSVARDWFGRAPLTRLLFCQGDAPKYRLLERFREEAPAILLGSMSFWEGVDVKGPALSLILIDRLPFSSPADPGVYRRIRTIRDEGGDPFPDYQLPKAILTLRQGVGRLLRHESDYGAVVIGDRRVRERGYGSLFLNSLPPMQRARDAMDVMTFLQSHG